MNKNLRLIAVSIAFLCIACHLNAQVVVRKTAKSKNPVITYRGLSGSPELSQTVGADLARCGWFDTDSKSKADFIIKGRAEGGSLALDVYNADGSGYTSVSTRLADDKRWTAHRAVDALLKRMFKVSALCATRIVFCAESGGAKQVYLADYDGHNVRRMTAGRRMCVEPDWFPDGASILYTMYGQNYTDIIQHYINSGKKRRIAQFKGLNAGGAVAPGGKVMAMILSRDSQVELYIKSVDGRAYQRLTNSRSVEASPCWSPRGDKISFVSDASGKPRMYLMPYSGGTPTSLNTYGTEAHSPDWSSDNQIVYSAKMGRNYTIAVLDLRDKEKSRIIVRAAGDWENPSWAPDNRHVVCSRTYAGNSSLYIIDTWTGKARRMLSGSSNTTMPSWSGPQ